MLDFEVFRKSPFRANNLEGLTMTITTRGYFAFAREAWEAFGSPPHVELLYNRTDRVIGLRRVAAPTENAYTARVSTNGRVYQVAAKSFCSFYGIDLSAAHRYPVRIDGDILIIMLADGVYCPPRGRRGASS